MNKHDELIDILKSKRKFAIEEFEHPHITLDLDATNKILSVFQQYGDALVRLGDEKKMVRIRSSDPIGTKMDDYHARIEYAQTTVEGE